MQRMMLDSDYWKNLRKQFRSIKDGARVRALWIEVPEKALEDWKVTGGRSAVLEFEALARRAGSKMDQGSDDPRAAWLSALKRERHHDDRVSDGGSVRVLKGRKFVHLQAGRIENACGVSADYCSALESIALELEHLSRRQSVPANRRTEETFGRRSPANKLVDKQQAKRGKIRSAWLDQQRSAKGWTSDLDIQVNEGPAYNTIRRYRSGATSTREPYVRLKLAKAFACQILKVPE